MSATDLRRLAARVRLLRCQVEVVEFDTRDVKQKRALAKLWNLLVDGEQLITDEVRAAPLGVDR